jgi:hypothetical protein
MRRRTRVLGRGAVLADDRLLVYARAQYLSKYGESCDLLKDPSWTKDEKRADKGASLDAMPCPSPRRFKCALSQCSHISEGALTLCSRGGHP